MQHLLSKEAEIADFLAAGGSHAAVDTEFQRDRSFYPRLSLVQIHLGGEPAILDLLAVRRPLSLLRWLGDPAVEKVMHAPG
ncbi:MAG: hypothetical protein RML12_07805 [Xanthomonadales bacterium]|nr:hypothetical protein [Xanthomonadales bacterium]